MLRLGKEQEARHHPLLEADGIFLSLRQVGDAAWGHRGIPQGPEFILTRLEETDTCSWTEGGERGQGNIADRETYPGPDESPASCRFYSWNRRGNTSLT